MCLIETSRLWKVIIGQRIWNTFVFSFKQERTFRTWRQVFERKHANRKKPQIQLIIRLFLYSLLRLLKRSQTITEVLKKHFLKWKLHCVLYYRSFSEELILCCKRAVLEKWKIRKIKINKGISFLLKAINCIVDYHDI